MPVTVSLARGEGLVKEREVEARAQGGLAKFAAELAREALEPATVVLFAKGREVLRASTRPDQNIKSSAG